MVSAFRIYLKARRAPLHALASMLLESERPALTVFDGEPAVVAHLDNESRFGVIRSDIMNHEDPAVRNVEVCVEYDPPSTPAA